ESRATSISHSGSVRSEQRSLGEKDLPPSGLRRIWPVASLLVGHSPTAGGCSLLAPRHRPNWAQRTSSDLCLRPLSPAGAGSSPAARRPTIEDVSDRLPPVQDIGWPDSSSHWRRGPGRTI